jgi:phenylacetate-coenzyme A ligase PaaK-like adenylate-forming protein
MVFDDELESLLPRLSQEIGKIAGRPVSLDALFSACERLSKSLEEGKSQVFRKLHADLVKSVGSNEATVTLSGIAEFLRPSTLRKKLLRETGSHDPFTPKRIAMAEPVFEAWAPLGFLVHIAPGNAPAVGVLSVIEGLLAGNFNALKTSSADGGFSTDFFDALNSLDPTGEIAGRVLVADLRSSEVATLQKILNEASGIAVWGGEEAVSAIRAKAPRDARLVEWGHKLSFSYVANEHIRRTETVRALTRDICALSQQACSSPQCIYLETTSQEDLKFFARQLAIELKHMEQGAEAESWLQPDSSSAAEISMTVAVQECEAALGLGEVIQSDSGAWRIFIDYAPALRASPLYRTIWIKGLPASDIFPVLWPMRAWLQTAGLSCKQERVAELSTKLVAAGILRITQPGNMLESYIGEPHDGFFALPRYMRRISYQLPEICRSIASFGDIETYDDRPPWSPEEKPAIMNKADFQAQAVDDSFAHLFFKSGGSSGEPKISVFTYDDYHGQMNLAAEGLFAAGLDPSRHRCMNLFFGGGLYGGFVSFFTILESMGAVQLPMAAHLDFKFVGDMILRHRVDTVLGMPSYLMRLFEDPANSERLARLRPVKRVFFGGEHFSEAQKRLFTGRFGVELIRSAAYGSVDSGPLGYQCEHTSGSIHHLHHRLQYLEILEMDRDVPVASGNPGRMVFSSRMRHGQELNRYDIGDMGRFVTDNTGKVAGSCLCGRTSPRFELLGRHGDVFRAGGAFFNYQKFLLALESTCEFVGELQIVIDRPLAAANAAPTTAAPMDRITIQCASTGSLPPKEEMVKHLLAELSELRELVVDEGTLTLEIHQKNTGDLARISGSGKLRHIIDLR